MLSCSLATCIEYIGDNCFIACYISAVWLAFELSFIDDELYKFKCMCRLIKFDNASSFSKSRGFNEISLFEEHF